MARTFSQMPINDMLETNQYQGSGRRNDRSKCGSENSRLTRTSLAQYRANFQFKSHVKHSVSFIKHLQNQISILPRIMIIKLAAFDITFATINLKFSTKSFKKPNIKCVSDLNVNGSWTSFNTKKKKMVKAIIVQILNLLCLTISDWWS